MCKLLGYVGAAPKWSRGYRMKSMHKANGKGDYSPLFVRIDEGLRARAAAVHNLFTI
jgi:hypothetical protein